MSIKPLVFALLSVVSAVSFADENKAGKFYLGLDAGSGKVKKDPLTPNYRITSETDRVDGGRLYIGYQITPKLSVELGAVRPSDYKQSATNGVLSYNARVETKNHDLTLFYKVPELLPGLFVLGGVTYSKVVTSAQFTSVLLPSLRVSGSTRKTDTDFAWGGGYEARLFGNVDGRIMYARYAGTNLVTVGLKYRFQ
ncbi:Hypothetical protein mma_2822 [Janthinobacterium sp. Marseille]|nr:outer membrane beta-barrel protein [Janthinobacterium sp. Marseille]ABR91878.1 Hypothetical protein mma_2822 [Janthinobacterium sp. Marseille]